MNEFNPYFYADITDVKIDKDTWETLIATPYNDFVVRSNKGAIIKPIIYGYKEE